EITMILRPLAKIKCRGSLLHISGKEILLETRLEYVKEDDDRPERERCFGPDGLEAKHETEMLELLGVRNPWVKESGTLGGKQATYFPCGPTDTVLVPVYECILRSCNYYFRDLAQEKQERDFPGRPYLKLPLEYLTNLS